MIDRVLRLPPILFACVIVFGSLAFMATITAIIWEIEFTIFQ